MVKKDRLLGSIYDQCHISLIPKQNWSGSELLTTQRRIFLNLVLSYDCRRKIIRKTKGLNTWYLVRSFHNTKDINDTTQNPTTSLPLRENTHPCLSCWGQGHFSNPLRSSSPVLVALFGCFPLRFLSGLPPAPLGLFLTRSSLSEPIQPNNTIHPHWMHANSSVGSMWPHFSEWKSIALDRSSKGSSRVLTIVVQNP